MQLPQPTPATQTVPRPASTHCAAVEQPTQAPVAVSQKGAEPWAQAPASVVHGGRQMPFGEKPTVLQLSGVGHWLLAEQPQTPAVELPMMHSGALPPQPELPVQVQTPVVHVSLAGQSVSRTQAPQISIEQPGFANGQSVALRH